MISFVFGIGTLFVDIIARFVSVKIISKMKLDELFQRLEISKEERKMIEKTNSRRSLLNINLDNL